MMKLNVDYIPFINYALVNNRIAVCQSVDIVNETDEEMRNVVVECSGEFFQESRSDVVDTVAKRATIRIVNVDLKVVLAKVASVTERCLTTFTIKVIADAHTENERTLISNDYNIEVMPYDQWLGTTILPQCLASFVLPNNPAINNVVVKAAAKLKELSGSSSFAEYQSGNPNEVRKQVAAVYWALHSENIVYRALPASYEAVGQRITLPDQVLASKLGNCIELTLLFASVLENIGINTCIILQKGHAFLGIWLVDDCCQYSVCDDSSFIEKKCAEGINEMMVIECTHLAAEKTSFEDALTAAQKSLADTSAFDMFVDVKRCRLERVLPLPQRTLNNGVFEIATDGVCHDECVVNVKEHSRFDLSSIAESDYKATKMDIWERKLLDFTLRNSMLNLHLRQKAIQFISFDVNLIEDYLQEGNEYKIFAKPNIDYRISEDERFIRSRMYPELHELIHNDILHHTLHTYQTEGETKSTLKNIYRAARNAIEETGANALYLAIGTLRWFETDMSETPRYAPILMLPVEMVYKKGDYYIRTGDGDIVMNITLVELLRQNYGITIPGLDQLPTDEHGVDVSKIFAIFREVLRNKKRWDVEEEAILGVFSFSKYLMWHDIHNNREKLMESEIVRSLVEQRLAFAPSGLDNDLKDSDKTMKPDTLALPVPIDSSQMAAVIEAGKGNSFILYGPPGTGKSQTITNLIANALFQGKRVLFVAEKMAALSVVQKRLEKIHLAPFCLEMHSNKITKRHVLEQLKMALDVTHIVEPEEYSRIANELFEQRETLIEYMEALHDTKGAEGMSLYDCITGYESIAADTIDFDANEEELKRNFHISKRDKYDHLLADKYPAVLEITGQPSENPLCGLTVEEADLADKERLLQRMRTAISLLEECNANRQRLSSAEGLKAEILRDCKPSILGEDAKRLYDEWRAIKAKWFIPRLFAKKDFVKRMRQYNEFIVEQEIETLLPRLVDYAEKHAAISAIQATVKEFFDVRFDDDALPTEKQAAEFTAILNRWIKNKDKIRDWYQWCAFKKELYEAGLGVVARAIEQSSIPGSSLRDSFLKTLYRHLAETKIAQSSILRTFEGAIFDETIARYKKLTEEFQMLSQKELYARLASRIPRVTDNIDNSSEIGLLNRNISNGGRGVSLRGLIDQIPTLMPRLCPCMLMSPMSVAQFLDLSHEKFDLVIFDEASQMPTSEAVGAIARGKAVIVVGDPKQMPPTSFFSSTNVSDDEVEIDDMESILEDCRTLEIPSLQLNWHYRSKHESLIAFSNNEYYDGTLITFPSADDKATKVKYHYVDGVYDKGGHRSNRKEAEAIVAEIARRLEQPSHLTESIGVIAFSVVQQNLIEDMLMEMLDRNKRLREASEEMYEPIFVKNLENVQGDERDVILFSVGYGPDKDGKVSMNFGPLNNVGGERRLNVAVSRARREMMVYSSLKSSQIDLRRSKAKGVEGLKHFLEYAEQQILIQTSVTAQNHTDSAMAEQIAKALRKRGLTADTNIGRSNFKVDVAVGDGTKAGIYTLAILLDGKGYHDTKTTRDREIVQPSVLKMLNWKIMRVWSVDWLNNPERVLSRIEAKLKEKDVEPEAEMMPSFDVSKEEVVVTESNQKEYTEYPADKDVSGMSDKELMQEILSYEQPMTMMYLCRRICALRGLPRVTPTMVTTMTEIAKAEMHLQEMGSTIVVWKEKVDAETYAGYRQNNGRDITEIPLVEVMNAIEEAVKEQFSINRESLTFVAAKQLGFTRRGAKVDQALKDALELLVADNRIIETDGMLKLP